MTASIPDVRAGELPTILGGVRIRIGPGFVSLLYVSPTQINFLIPSDLAPGAAEMLLNRAG